MTLELYEDDILIDKVNSYFGMRKVHTEDGKVYLNNRPYYLKLVLDQGYYKDSLLTSPNDEALIKDIELAKKMGYNGARLHQKIEEERYLYYADKLGFLVWGEMPSTATYDESYHKDIINEWVNVIERDYNHPSLMAWVPLNESWGVSQINHDKGQQNYALSLYYLTKSLDPTRLVISNDGWELVTTDIFAFHNYSHGQIDELDKQKAYENNLLNLENILKSKPAGRNMYANGFKYEGEPVLLTEFGGISFNKDNNNGWGYTNVNTQENFIKEYERLLNAINKSEVIAGFCYTQLTDVEQEVNGLLNYDRSLKVDLNIIKNINDKVNFK